MIKAIIFDFDGIFIQNPNLNKGLKKYFRMPVREFVSKFEKEEKVSETMVSLSKHLRDSGIKIFILSNTIKAIAEYYEHYPWMHEVIDKAYFSFETGFKKPDIRAWENILSENNLKSEECIYFDDQEKHLKAPKNIGIKSFLFTNEKYLKDKVKELLHVSKS